MVLNLVGVTRGSIVCGMLEGNYQEPRGAGTIVLDRESRLPASGAVEPIVPLRRDWSKDCGQW